MENSPTIQKVIKIFEGEFAPNKQPTRIVCRYSDCFVHYLYGEAEYDFGDYRFTATCENFFYLAKNSAYQIHVTKPSKYICIDFDFENAESNRESRVFQNRSVSLKNDFSKLFRLWNISTPWRNAKVYSGIYNLYAEALKTEQKKYAQSNPRFDEITNLVFDNYCDPVFSVKKISEKTNLSEMHIRRIFKSALDVTPIKYIHHLRLEKAKTLLRSSNYSIAEVAEAVGVSDPYYFSRLFKKEIGMTPFEYKKLPEKNTF